MRRVKISLTPRGLSVDKNAAIGIGSLIMFIAMILVAGMAASVMIQTMNSFEQQALQTGQETIRDVSSGLRVTQISGYVANSLIDQIAIFVETTAGSEDMDLTEAYISVSDSSVKTILNYSTSIFSSSVSSGLFGTVNSSLLSSSTYGIMVVRDVDSSCTSTNPIINDEDLVVLLVNATDCFSGLSTRTEVFGDIIPEFGMNGVISFTTPSAYVNTIVDLQ